jgi:hypothetical protein
MTHKAKMTTRQTCQMPIRTPHGLGRCGRPAVDYIIPPENVYPDFAVLHKGERRMYLCASCWDEMHDRED